MNQHIRIGTRGSDLALAQAHAVERDLRARGATTEIVIVKTTGDLDLTRSFQDLGPAGVFAVELRVALLEERVDIAVHSAKDLPGLKPSGLEIIACPERVAPHDRLLMRPEQYEISAPGLPLKHGARLGTAAARRIALAREVRPDLEIGVLRGNVPTRIAKLRSGEHDAILLAAAGLDRLSAAHQRGECGAPDLTDLLVHDLNPEAFTPAPGQGSIAIEAREGCPVGAQAAALDDPLASRCLTAEREALVRVDAGCHTPFGAWCRQLDGGLIMSAVLEVNGSLHRSTFRGEDPELLAGLTTGQLLDGGV
jgi:hydroxymethylbilane synthase